MVASPRATTEKRSSPILLKRDSAAAPDVFNEERAAVPPLFYRTRRGQGALHRLRYDHRRAFIEMHAVGPAQLASVHFDGQPSLRIRKRSMNNLPRGRGGPRAFDRLGIRQLKQEYPRAALFHHPDQLCNSLRVELSNSRRILRIELLLRAIHIDPVVEIARRLREQSAQLERDLLVRQGRVKPLLV